LSGLHDVNHAPLCRLRAAVIACVGKHRVISLENRVARNIRILTPQPSFKATTTINRLQT